MTREEAINRFKGIRESFSTSIAQSKFYPSKVILNELCDMAIEALQTDAVVRCKDCKWYKPNQLVPVHPLLGGGIVYENHCDVNFGFAPKENDFCSRAKMKGGADNG